MNRRILRFTPILALVAMLLLSACDPTSLLSGTPDADATPASAGEGEILTLYVGPELVDCVGVAPMQCMQVKDSPDGEYQLWYDPIEGFDYEAGYNYAINVAVTPVENPPADASSNRYTLVEVLSKEPAGESTPVVDATPVADAALEGTLWKLDQLAGPDGALAPASALAEATITFQDGQYAGNDGCNNYFGAYTLDGDSLTIQPGGSTMMACPPELMAQEQAYLELLGKVASYEISGNQLTLSDADGNTLLVYSALAPTPLTGVTWVAVAYNNGAGGVVSILGGTEITALFGDDGSLSGSAGCNSYTASYQIDGDAITIGPAAATRMMCAEPEGIMDQEAQYLQALTTAATYAIQGDELTLRTADGATVAVYTAQVSAMGEFDADTLANMTYISQFTESGSATLVNGEYREPIADSSAEIYTALLDQWAAGELNGQPAAAVTLATNTGGTGVFVELAVVTKQDGEPVNVATTLLGDRVRVNSVAIENNQIVVDMITQGPEDPMCCPSQQVIQTYELQGEELALVSSAVVGTVPDESSTPTLTGAEWQWIGSVYSDDSELQVPDSSLYTLSFQDDGTFNLRADCNVGSGNYTVDGNSLSLVLGPMTLAACPPESLSDKYLQELSDVVSYIITDDGNLVLNLKVDAGNMNFAPSAPAGEATGEAPAASELSGVVWQWGGTTYEDGTQTTVDNPAQYTVEFMTDGTVAIVADCNSASGTYTVDGSSLRITVGPMTMAACPPESLSDQFVRELSMAASYVMTDGNLVINMAMDGGNMQFSPAAGVSQGETETPATTTPVGGAWQWLGTSSPTGEELTIRFPARYTVNFLADGTLNIRADCNKAIGTYTLDGSSITIDAAASTRAACPKGSRSQLFLKQLNQAGTWVMDGENLVINLQADSGDMKFAAAQ